MMGYSEFVTSVLVYAVFLVGQSLVTSGQDIDDVIHDAEDLQKSWIQANMVLFIFLVIGAVVVLGLVFSCCCCCCACCRNRRTTIIAQGGGVPQSTVIVSQQQQQMGAFPSYPANPVHAGYDQ